MVKHEKASYKNDSKKKNMVVNLGKGGGVGGVIFLGGVLVAGIVASVLAVRKRNQKSKCDKRNNPKTSAPLHSFDSEQETKGLQFLVTNCCPEEHQQLRYRKAVGGVRKANGVPCSNSNENICKDVPGGEFETNKQCPDIFSDQVVEEDQDLRVDNEGNHQERAKNDHGNVRDLEDRKMQMGEGEKASSLAQEDNHENSIEQSSILDRKQPNLGSLVSEEDPVQMIESEEMIGSATQGDDRENAKLQLDDNIIEERDEFVADEIQKHDLEVPNSGAGLDGFALPKPGNRIQDVSSTSQVCIDSIEMEDVTKESLDGEDMTEDEGEFRMSLMAIQQYTDDEISTLMEINETSDTSSAYANLEADDTEKSNEEFDTYEDDEILDDNNGDGSPQSTEEVEDSSEGTLDSSAESNSEPVFPTEIVQEIGIAHEAEPEKGNTGKTNDERLVQREQMNHNEEANFKLIFKLPSDSRTTIINWYNNLHLDLRKWRILLGTLLVLLMHLCFQYNVKEENQQSSV